MQTNENRRESLPAPWLALGAGVACAALWVLGYMGGLGVGMTASSLLILGVGMYLCRRQICWRADSILLLTLAVLLSLAYGIFGSLAMQIFNLPVLCLLLSQSLLALAGHCPEGALSAAGLSGGIREALGSLFRHWGVPFHTVKERQGSASALRGLGMGLLIAVPLLAVVLFLLAWADTVFSSLLSGLFVSEDPLSAFWNVLWRLIKLLAIALLVWAFAGHKFRRRKEPQCGEIRRRNWGHLKRTHTANQMRRVQRANGSLAQVWGRPQCGFHLLPRNTTRLAKP